MRYVTLFASVALLSLTIRPTRARMNQHTRLKFQIERVGADYVFSFEPCGKSARDQTPFLSYVVEEVRDDDNVQVCGISYFGEKAYQGPKPRPQPTRSRRWRYGEVPPGYEEFVKCKPLEAGKTYGIAVQAAGASVDGGFRIEKNGKLTVLQPGACKAPPN